MSILHICQVILHPLGHSQFCPMLHHCGDNHFLHEHCDQFMQEVVMSSHVARNAAFYIVFFIGFTAQLFYSKKPVVKLKKFPKTANLKNTLRYVTSHNACMMTSGKPVFCLLDNVFNIEIALKKMQASNLSGKY